MNQDNRVLGRKGARELTLREMEHVNGGIVVHTNTVCTFADIHGAFDGDKGECS